MGTQNRKRLLEDILESFHSIKQALARHAVAKRAFFATSSQGLVFFFIARRGTLGVKEIAAGLNITSSAATQLIDRLVRKGYLSRKENPGDRRALMITLSPKGKRHFGLLQKEGVKKMSLLFEILKEDEVEEYYRLNRKIASALSSGGEKREK